MKLSIIVVTIGPLALVKRLLASLLTQACKNFEVILVHGPDISVDDAKSLTTSFADLNIVLLQSVDTCLSRSRNLGLTVAKGAAIAFADDDCVYEPDTVGEVCATFKRHSEAHVLMGYSANIGERLRPQPRTPIRLNRYNVFSGCPSYVHFYRAEVVQAVGQFDEYLGVGCNTPFLSGEETDYALRALSANFSIMRAPAVIVRHPAMNLRSQTLQTKTRAYAAGRMRLLHKQNLPLWFMLVNVAYPLLRIPLDCLAECLFVIRYRWAMFTARLVWLKKAK